MKTLHIYTETQEVKIWGQITPVGNRKEYFRKKICFILNKVPVLSGKCSSIMQFAFSVEN